MSSPLNAAFLYFYNSGGKKLGFFSWKTFQNENGIETITWVTEKLKSAGVAYTKILIATSQGVPLYSDNSNN